MYTATGLTDKEECIKEYAPLVKRIAHHLMLRLPSSVAVDDIIQAGKSEQEAVKFLVDRYGDFVLYKPPLKPATLGRHRRKCGRFGDSGSGSGGVHGVIF